MDDSAKSLVLGAFVFANAGGLLAAYVSIVTKLTRLETKFENTEKDLNALWQNLRTKKES